MLKCYWTASGQFYQAIEKLLENAQIELIITGQMFLLAWCDEKNPGDEAVSQKETRHNYPLACCKHGTISIHFL
jgi:hypothetical protein